jgi:hypothetical protein
MRDGIVVVQLQVRGCKHTGLRNQGQLQRGLEQQQQQQGQGVEVPLG